MITPSIKKPCRLMLAAAASALSFSTFFSVTNLQNRKLSDSLKAVSRSELRASILRSDSPREALKQVTNVGVKNLPCDTGQVDGWPVLTNFHGDAAGAIATPVHGFLSQCSTKIGDQRVYRVDSCDLALSKLASIPTFWSHTAVSDIGADENKPDQCLLVLYPTLDSEFPCLRTINGENELLCGLNPEKYDIKSWRVNGFRWQNDEVVTNYFNQTGQQVSEPVPSRSFSFGLLGYRVLVRGEESVPVSGYFETRILADMILGGEKNNTRNDSFYFRANFGDPSNGENPGQKNGNETNLSKKYEGKLTKVIEISPKEGHFSTK